MPMRGRYEEIVGTIALISQQAQHPCLFDGSHVHTILLLVHNSSVAIGGQM